MSSRPAHLLCLFLLGIAVPFLPGCYHYRVLAPKPDPATEYESRTVHSLFWGLVQENVKAADCQSNALDEVRVNTNLGYLSLSVATIGIWVPLRVEWRCAKPASPGGNL